MPPFDLADLPQLLREDMELQHTREDIVQYFRKHTNEDERAAYLEHMLQRYIGSSLSCTRARRLQLYRI